MGSAGAGGDCNDKLLMRLGLIVKVTLEQRPEEGRELFCQYLGEELSRQRSVAAEV